MLQYMQTSIVEGSVKVLLTGVLLYAPALLLLYSARR